MKKLILIFLLMLFCNIVIIAQTPPILFDSNIETYELIDNPTSLNNGEVWESNSIFPINFGFDFEIYGTIYNTLLVDAGIGLTFPGFNPRTLWIWASEWGGSPFLYDFGVDTSLSPIDYKIVGDTGSRILKIQWQNAGIKPDAGVDDTTDFVNFQMWVCEGSNRIEVHYGESQTSDSTFWNNDGPGIRFYNIEVDWGICVFGYEDYPSWEYKFLNGPIPGCLLWGVPSKDVVFNFYPNPTVSINERMNTNNLGFSVISNNDNLKIIIDCFISKEVYKLEIYNELGSKILTTVIDSDPSFISRKKLDNGLYIFRLKKDNIYFAKKVILN